MNLLNKIEQGLGDMDDAARVAALVAEAAATLSLPDACWAQAPDGLQQRRRLAHALARVLEDRWARDNDNHRGDDDAHTPTPTA